MKTENKTLSFKRAMAAFLIASALTGCKTEVHMTVNMSDLLKGGESKLLTGQLYQEVPACVDHQDSRVESSSLIKLKQKMPKAFPDSVFVECFTKSFTSWAHFQVPIMLDKVRNGHLDSDKYLNIVSNKELLLGIGVPNNLRDEIKALEKGNPATGMDLFFYIKVNNDYDTKTNFEVIASFVDGQPFIYGNLTINERKSMVVEPSDVSVKKALEGDDKVAKVLFLTAKPASTPK